MAKHKEQSNEHSSSVKLGLSGNIAKTFYKAEITPLLALVAILLGIFATVITPKEEDPQINVTFANVFIAYPGASAQEVESLITSPAENVLSEIKGIEHIYSSSSPGMSILSVQFKVGEPRTEALVRLYNKLYSHQDWLPKNLGVMQPIVKPKGIDNVPIMTLTLSGKNNKLVDRTALSKVAHAIETEIKRIPGTNEVYTIGAPDDVVKVELDPQKMAALNISFNDLRSALSATNVTANSASTVVGDRYVLVQAGAYLSNTNELKDLIVGMNKNSPVFLSDVATIKRTGDTPKNIVQIYQGFNQQSNAAQASVALPAVTLAIAKKAGVNAADVVNEVNQRLKQLRGTYIPDDIKITTTRDYGKTATDKANHLIKKLFLVTFVVILLIWAALGIHEAIIVGAAVIVTLMATLFASWAFGFTINRVSLFALIFAIGILVDDAIVVVENIHRHIKLGKQSLTDAIPVAVNEVGGPTILATFTVIAALLPMAFVSGLMGPYMSPIPINASAGMFLSLMIAFIFTPWLTYKVLKHKHPADDTAIVAEQETKEEATQEPKQENSTNSRFYRMVTMLMKPFLYGKNSARKRHLLYFSLVILIGLSLALVVTQHVILKMLPFDNKSEFQVIVDMPEGTPLETTNRVLDKLAVYLQSVKEITNIESYAGTAAPINFNGLVRQYYLRSKPNMGDLQVNLQDKNDRKRNSHDIALSVRKPLQQIGKKFNANIKIVEVPPGPPVFAPIVAEVYGQNYPQQIAFAKKIKQKFLSTADIVDVDDSIEANTTRFIIHIDRQKAAHLGVSQRVIVVAIKTALDGEDASYLHSKTAKYPIPIRLRFSNNDKAAAAQFLQLKVRSNNGTLVPIRDLVNVEETTLDKTRYHKDLLPVVYVTADSVGKTDSPLYGMFSIMSALTKEFPKVEQALTSQPKNPYLSSLKWDGEWQITYETFRDMGIAYGVGLIVIFLLIVGQFKSYAMPLVIMAPIPMTLIGIMPGHALFGSQFTATSMIGMIALAGIIVRNSILLVDFINIRLNEGIDLKNAVIDAAATRARPIILTAIAAILDAVFILDDPIFNGLAVSLISGVLVSTLLTLIVIPLLYYSVVRRKHIAVEE